MKLSGIKVYLSTKNQAKHVYHLNVKYVNDQMLIKGTGAAEETVFLTEYKLIEYVKFKI